MSVTEQLGGPAAQGPLPGTGGQGGGLRDAVARFALLPLRLFLGLTFIYAGVDKYTDVVPFTSTMSMDAMTTMLEYGRDASAAPWLVDLVLDHPDQFGTGVAVAEITVGACVLLGLLTRLAALGGTLLALSFWLTVSWSDTPYYFGQDLPYLVGFLTLVLAGSGPYGVDRLFSTRQQHQGQLMFG